METQTKEEILTQSKADVLNRFIAKLIDALIVGGLSLILRPVGPIAGLTYILICDGFKGGISLGKRLIGLRVINKKTGKPCSYKESIIRNLPFAIVVLFSMIPFLGWFLFFTLGIAIIAFEFYLIYSDPLGIRIGDTLADTQVIHFDIEK